LSSKAWKFTVTLTQRNEEQIKPHFRLKFFSICAKKLTAANKNVQFYNTSGQVICSQYKNMLSVD